MMKTEKFIATVVLGSVIGLISTTGVLAVGGTETPTATPTATVAPTAAPTATPAPTVKPTVRAQQGQVKATALARAKEVALKVFNNQFLNRFATVRTNVNANAKLGADAKAALISKLDAEIAWFTAKRDTVDAATTVTQVRAIVAEARTRFQVAAKEVRRLHIASGLVTSLENVIANIESSIFPKIQGFLDQLTEKGIDVQTEQALFNDAKAKVALAKNEIPLVRNSATFEEAKSHFDLAKGYLKQARESLKGISTSLKAKLPVVTPTVSPTATPTATPSTT